MQSPGGQKRFPGHTACVVREASEFPAALCPPGPPRMPAARPGILGAHDSRTPSPAASCSAQQVASPPREDSPATQSWQHRRGGGVHTTDCISQPAERPPCPPLLPPAAQESAPSWGAHDDPPAPVRTLGASAVLRAGSHHCPPRFLPPSHGLVGPPEPHRHSAPFSLGVRPLVRSHFSNTCRASQPQNMSGWLLT